PADSQETFGYDQLNRLISSDIDIPALSYHPPTQSYDYDALGLGNIQHKDGKTYTYGDCGAGPHAVCTVGGSQAFTYDANGSMTAGNGRNLHYDTLNKLVHIDEGGNSVELIY